MKKLVLISVCIMSLAFVGSAASSVSKLNQAPTKKEAPAVKKAHAKKAGTKKVAKTPVTPAAPMKK